MKTIKMVRLSGGEGLEHISHVRFADGEAWTLDTVWDFLDRDAEDVFVEDPLTYKLVPVFAVPAVLGRPRHIRSAAGILARDNLLGLPRF